MTEQMKKNRELVEEAVVKIILDEAKEPDSEFIKTLPALLEALVGLWHAG